jgi:hypothetical protein
MANIRIAAAIASQHGITLYLENGKEMNLPTTSWRTKAILDDILKRLSVGEIVEIDPETYSIEARVEKETKGLLRFTKKTKSFVAGLFGKNAANDDFVSVVLAPADPVKKFSASVAPAAVSVQEEETELVAIVTNKATGKETMIPGVAALEKHVESAVMNNNVAGLQRFMERLASMQAKRSHTVQELLRFMERGDLPIADDGCIVAYKVLQSSGSNGYFVDCHTKRIQQRVGSKVQQAESLIDQDRRHECSTGLHIARRGYLKQFGGDIITIVKVAPEDVVAVPNYDANKMRAASYHIVGQLPSEIHSVLRADKPMTGNVVAAKILADVIAGNHIGVVETVSITEANGGSFIVTPVSDGGTFVSGQAGFARALDAPVDGLKPADIRAAVEANVAAKKEEIKKVKAVKSAAETGDLAAALSVSAAPAKAKKPKPEPKKKLVATKPNNLDAEQLPTKHLQALEMRKSGMSNRAIEAELHICRKTLKKLFDKHG